NKKYGNRYLIFIPVFSLLCACWQQVFAGDDFRYRDSLRSYIFEHGSASVDCYLSYPVGNSAVDPAFGNNARELDVLHRFLRYALEDTLVCVQNVRITGYSSPDGTDLVNQRISTNRANRLLRYLNADYRLSENYPVEVLSQGADWVKLREMIAASPYKWRDDALRIIDGTDTSDRKKMQLGYLGGGDAHKRLYEEFYPLLRRVEITIHYDVQCMKHKIRRAELPDLSNYAIRVLKLKAMQFHRITNPMKRRPAFHPVFALRTNLYAWAGMTPEFKYRRFMPNLGAELFFARRWSVVASATYADWDYDKEKHWGVSGYRVEPRFWLLGDRRFRYFYLGVFGQAGDYNDRSVMTLQGCTGTYWQTGLSAGCYLPLIRHLGIELGVRGGYEDAKLKLYSVETDAFYLDAKDNHDRWGIVGVDIGVSWRF
ncbi:DUF3575 domain-containing protein, partial [Bacteroides sp.]